VYIPRFSKQCNELPDVADTDIIRAFLSGTTYEFLVHKLGRKCLRNTKELLNIATSHALARRRSERFLTAPKVRQSRTRTPMRVPPTTLRRRTRSDIGTHSWPLLSTRAKRHLLRVPQITSRSYLRDHA
jgi:hypothetical protein